jgi:hypothetical protein
MSELNPNNTSQFIIELVREGTVRNFRTVQTEGERKIAREIPLVPKLQLRETGDWSFQYRIPKQELSLLYTSVTKPVILAGIAGIQTTGMYLSSPSMALDTRFPAGMTNYPRTCI